MQSNLINKLKDLDNKKRFESNNKRVASVKKIFGSSSYDGLNLGLDDNEIDLDDLVNKISRAKKTDGYIARTSNSILQKSLKMGWFFESSKHENCKLVEKRFNDLMLLSGYNPRSFIRETLKNLIDYSNVFIVREYMDNKLTSLTILPSIGWTPNKISGNLVTEWSFEYGETVKTFTNKEVIHLYYNKETHEVFGVPFMSSVLEDIQLLRDLESNSIEDYYKYLNKKTVFLVGNDKVPASEKEIREIKNLLNSLEDNEDLVLSGRVKVEIIEPKYIPPDFLVNSMKERSLAGLLSSKSQMGSGGSGRQDADTQETRETITVEDFQENLEDQLNNSIFREICLELFNEYNSDLGVFFKFRRSQNEYERTNNHFLNLYHGGAISFNELRNKIQMNYQDFNEEESFEAYKNRALEVTLQLESKYNPKPTNGSTTVSKPKNNSKGSVNTTKSLNTPSNQHGTKPNSKKSVKD
ncbi:MAG: hypothetical protein ACRCXT_16595 [Paraclostridium sp.]